ncbi:hypothetical protein GY45DRAFT_1319881 [Cubamyces sp. BRFM 1775]|nr:hypothetical protein GY45DRAFT_1319881 [Cubamyces sp. BRFM 1775]
MLPARPDVHARVRRDPKVRADRPPVAALPVAVPVVEVPDHLAAREVERPADVRVRPVEELGVVCGDVPDAAREVGGVARDGAAGGDGGNEGKEKRDGGKEGEEGGGGRVHGDWAVVAGVDGSSVYWDLQSAGELPTLAWGNRFVSSPFYTSNAPLRPPVVTTQSRVV